MDVEGLLDACISPGRSSTLQMTKAGDHSHVGEVTGPMNGTHCQYSIVIPLVKLKKPCSKRESLHILGKESQNGDEAGGLTKTLQMSFSKQPFKRSLI